LQFALPHFEHFRCAIQYLSAQISALLRPIREGSPGRENGIAKIFFRCPTEIGEQSAAFSTRRQHPAIFTPDKFPVDEQLISLLNLEPGLLSWHGSEDCVNREKRKC
jgi:hypothetical protein